MKKTSKGFTLIELMVVVVILGILAVVVAPRIPELVKKAKEGATKGALATIRSALNIYYGDNDGWYPTADPTNILVPKYVKSISKTQLPTTVHAPSTAFVIKGTFTDEDNGKWGYVTDNGNNHWGTAWVDCTCNDSAGTRWSSY